MEKSSRRGDPRDRRLEDPTYEAAYREYLEIVRSRAEQTRPMRIRRVVRLPETETVGRRSRAG